jgi:hypothetical protein
MTANEILDQIKPLGRDNYKQILLNHGVQEPVFGVKIEELKKIQKRVKKDYQLALDLYDTGIYDAMYLAGDQEGPAEMDQGCEIVGSCPVHGCLGRRGRAAWLGTGSAVDRLPRREHGHGRLGDSVPSCRSRGRRRSRYGGT